MGGKPPRPPLRKDSVKRFLKPSLKVVAQGIPYEKPQIISFRFDEDAGFWRLIAGSGSNNGSVVAPVDQMATGMITVQMNRYQKFCRNYQTVQMYQSFLSVTFAVVQIPLRQNQNPHFLQRALWSE